MNQDSQNTSEQREQLHIGIVVDSFAQPLWIHQIIDVLNRSSVADIALVINAECCNKECKTLGNSGIHNALYRLYSAWELKAFAIENYVLSTRDVSKELQYIPEINLENEDSIPAIAEYGLDLILCFSKIAKKSICSAARYGVWYFSYGSENAKPLGPPYFWEVFKENPVSILQLCVLQKDGSNPIVVKQHVLSTQPESVARNQNNALNKAWVLLLQQLERVHKEGELCSLCHKQGRLIGDNYSAPKNFELILPLVKYIGRMIKRKSRRLLKERWFPAYRFGDFDPKATSTFTAIMPPGDRMWADPCVISWDNRNYIFVEEMEFSDMKGFISVMELSKDGSFTQPSSIIVRPYHVSYPQVFRYNDSFYMLLESSANRSIELYVCKDFPHKWEFESTLMSDVNGVDPTICYIDGLWWLFVSIDHCDGNAYDQLFAYYAETPYGPWSPQKKNPIVSDVRRARPAGQIINLEGQWLRPAQDCSSGTYGRAISINKILHLSPDDYREVEVAMIEPTWMRGLVGTHTLSIDNDLIVVDGYHYR